MKNNYITPTLTLLRVTENIITTSVNTSSGDNYIGDW